MIEWMLMVSAASFVLMGGGAAFFTGNFLIAVLLIGQGLNCVVQWAILRAIDNAGIEVGPGVWRGGARHANGRDHPGTRH